MSETTFQPYSEWDLRGGVSNIPVVGFCLFQDLYYCVCNLLVTSLYFLRRYFTPFIPFKDIIPPSKEKVKGPGKIWAKIANREGIYERDPNGLFIICIVCGEVNMRRKFYSGRWFYHKEGQLHNQKKHNAI